MLLLLMQAQSGVDPWSEFQDAPKPSGANPFAKYAPSPERLGPGPHTLIISDRNAITRIDYRTGRQCQRARDEIRRQTAPPPDTPGRIYGPSTVRAFCVPR